MIFHMRGKADGRRFARAVQHVVDVDGAPLGRAEIAELLDLLQQLHDTPVSADDEVGQFPILPAGLAVHRDELRRPGDPASGFLISWASISAMPIADLAADLEFMARSAGPASSAVFQQHQHVVGLVR
jgi:hypothetical protein